MNEPIEIVPLPPFAEREHHMVAEHGWRDLRWLDRHQYDPYDLDRPTIA